MDTFGGKDTDLLFELAKTATALKNEIGKKIVGQNDAVNDLIISFFAGGHSLLIGVPGLAKTMLIHSLAECLDLDFNRVQFTPDLMPADITGSEILFENKTTGDREFRFVKGPIFTNILLADEINRTPPKTQSALLQAMQEKIVTSSGKTFDLPNPFWVLATQNPIEQEGTYPLPEAQQDRFMFSIEIPYPDKLSEVDIVKRTTSPMDIKLNPIINKNDLISFRELIWKIPIADSVVQYAVNLVRATRPNSNEILPSIKKYLSWGAGPRASQFLVIAGKTNAILEGRVTPDISDIQKVANSILRHRLIKSFDADIENISINDIIKMLIKEINPL